jgi:hypothetical protein
MIGTDPDVDLLLQQHESGTSLMASLWHASKSRARIGSLICHRWMASFVPHEYVEDLEWNPDLCAIETLYLLLYAHSCTFGTWTLCDNVFFDVHREH